MNELIKLLSEYEGWLFDMKKSGSHCAVILTVTTLHHRSMSSAISLRRLATKGGEGLILTEYKAMAGQLMDEENRVR